MGATVKFTFITKVRICLIFLLFGANSLIANSQTQPSPATIFAQLSDPKFVSKLHYPKMVARFYANNGNLPAWIDPAKNLKVGKTWDAMLLLDCVLQFGLSHPDYHPKEMPYETLHLIIEKPAEVADSIKVKFDIFLTDAMLTFMNHLHFGKANPYFSAKDIDAGLTRDDRSENILQSALKENNFIDKVLTVQPQTKAYADLHFYLRLKKGQYVGDCYDDPKGEARTIAVNMERLRWEPVNSGYYLQVNVPSSDLELYENNSVKNFKVVLGERDHAFVNIEGQIDYFINAPNHKISGQQFISEVLKKTIKDHNYAGRRGYVIYGKDGKVIKINSQNLKYINSHPSSYYALQTDRSTNSNQPLDLHFIGKSALYVKDQSYKKVKPELNSKITNMITVSRASLLGASLLRKDGSLESVSKLQKMLANPKPKSFKLKETFPIKVSYFTCKVVDGLMVFYKDSYNLDELTAAKIYAAL